MSTICCPPSRSVLVEVKMTGQHRRHRGALYLSLKQQHQAGGCSQQGSSRQSPGQLQVGEVLSEPVDLVCVEPDGLQELAEEHALGRAVAAEIVVAAHLRPDALPPLARHILPQPVVPVRARPTAPAHIYTSSPPLPGQSLTGS